MNGFIEIIDSNKKRRYLNINYIEEVAESDNDSCYIYMAFNCPDATDQDYFIVKRPYDEIVDIIKRND